MNKAILILGGYGGVGRRLARLLLRETRVDVIIAGRRKEKADAFAAELHREFLPDRVTSRHADASDGESLSKAFRGVRLVVVLTTTPEFIRRIGQAALASGCDYLDILVSESTFPDLDESASAILRQQRIFITRAGFHPGLPAVFVRSGARYFDRYDRATIAMAMNARFERAGQAAEIIPLVSDYRAEICREGAWRKATCKDFIRMDMGSRFGRMKLFPIRMEEIKRMRDTFDLRETGAYVSGFNWFVDYVVMPVILLTQKIRKGLATGFLLDLFVWGVNRFSSPDQGVVFLNEAEGVKDGEKIKVRIVAEHDDAYLMTAIPVVACLKQYLDGALPPGLWMMGHVVDEKRLFEDMEGMGVRIRIEIHDAQGG